MRSFMLISSLLIAGCGTGGPVPPKAGAEVSQKTRLAWAQDRITNSQYVKDPRTGLCFNVVVEPIRLKGRRGSRFALEMGSHAEVPCDKVESLLSR
jgi:predicted small lipoprotein YifL